VYADQVTFGQSWSATGDPYWTNDIGAFFVRKGWAWYGAGDYQKGVDDLGYRELYTRWFQFGAFLPMFRSHGTDTPREPWRFGEPGTPFYDSITDMLRLRYRLIPHIYSIAGAVTQKGSSFIRPVAFEFPNDLKTHDLKTQFLFGKEILVNPVLKPMYYGVNSTPIADAPKTSPVYLPSGAEWFDFWTGKKSNGGQTLDANAPISRIPLYVRAGSIIPLGPDQQYASEKPADPIELRIYPGANSYYSLYEDEGEGYSYEKGVYSTIPIEWNEKTQTLTIGARKGTFPGILDHRTFRIVWVGDNHGAGIAPEENADSVVNYVGHKLTVIRKK
jgi:alpha-D-xyloside xylohydrolase